MRELNLTDAQMEHSFGILGELDLAPLLSSFTGGGNLVDFLAALPALKQVRDAKILRRLEAVWSADPDSLERAEADAALMETLEKQAARKPFNFTLEGLVAFFGGRGPSLSGIPGFSSQPRATGERETGQAADSDSRSDG